MKRFLTLLAALPLLMLAPPASAQTWNVNGPSPYFGPTVPVVCPNVTTGVMAACSAGGGGPSSITNLPTTVDTNTGAAGASTLRVTPSTAASTDASSTVTVGGTFQTVFALSTTRKGCFIENPTTATEALYVAVGTSPAAATTNAASLGPGSSFTCANGNIVISDLIAVTATTNGHAFIAKSQ